MLFRLKNPGPAWKTPGIGDPARNLMLIAGAWRRPFFVSVFRQAWNATAISLEAKSFPARVNLCFFR